MPLWGSWLEFRRFLYIPSPEGQLAFRAFLRVLCLYFGAENLWGVPALILSFRKVSRGFLQRSGGCGIMTANEGKEAQYENITGGG